MAGNQTKQQGHGNSGPAGGSKKGKGHGSQSSPPGQGGTKKGTEGHGGGQGTGAGNEGHREATALSAASRLVAGWWLRMSNRLLGALGTPLVFARLTVHSTVGVFIAGSI